MARQGVERRLAAILSADVVGYSRLMGADEAGTLARLKAHRAEFIDPAIAEHRGRIVKLMGDGALVEFPSVVDAVECAVAVQRGMAARNADVPGNERIAFRIGINLGDVIIDGDDIYGDGVNVAARLQELAKPGGVCISGTVFEHVSGKADIGFDDLGASTVKNIARPVHVYSWTDGSYISVDDAASSESSPALPDKPSIAVLPFMNMSGDPEQEYFADGIAEDIITALARVRWLFVISSNSSFTYKGSAVDLKKVAKQLGVRYVLEGSVRRAGKRVRITAQLIEAQADHHVWADRFDRELEDIFELQDEITNTIVTAILPEVDDAERERAQRKPSASLDAWDLYLRGAWHMYRFEDDSQAEARAFFRRAIDIDPGLSVAHSGLARMHILAYLTGAAENPDKVVKEALALAKRAVECDGRDAFARAILARVYSLVGEFDSAIAEAQAAISLNPSDAFAHYTMAWTLLFSGQPDESIPYFEMALRLNPRGAESLVYHAVGAVAFLVLGRYKEAVAWGRRALRHPRGSRFFWAHANLAASLAHLGLIDEARAALDDLMGIRPDFSRRFVEGILSWDDTEAKERYFTGLEKAGLPE